MPSHISFSLSDHLYSYSQTTFLVLSDWRCKQKDCQIRFRQLDGPLNIYVKT